MRYSYYGTRKYTIEELKEYVDKNGLKSLSTKHIKQLLKARGCKGYTGMNKDELMAFYRMECEKYASDVDALRVEAKRMGIPGTGDMKTRELIRRIVKLEESKGGSEQKAYYGMKRNMTVPELKREAKKAGLVVSDLRKNTLIRVLVEIRKGVIPELLTDSRLIQEAKRLNVPNRVIRMQGRNGRNTRLCQEIRWRSSGEVTRPMAGVSLDDQPLMSEQKEQRILLPSFFEHLNYRALRTRWYASSGDNMYTTSRSTVCINNIKIHLQGYYNHEPFNLRTLVHIHDGKYTFVRRQRYQQPREFAMQVLRFSESRPGVLYDADSIDRFMYAMSRPMTRAEQIKKAQAIADGIPIIEQMRLLKKKASQTKARALAASQKAQAAADRTVKAFAIGKEDVCPICYDAFEQPVLTKCGHVFCKECLGDLVDYARGHGRIPVCPMCRAKLRER